MRDAMTRHPETVWRLNPRRGRMVGLGVGTGGLIRARVGFGKLDGMSRRAPVRLVSIARRDDVQDGARVTQVSAGNHAP